MSDSVASRHDDDNSRTRRRRGSDGSDDDDAVVVRGRRNDNRRSPASDGEASLGSEAMSESDAMSQSDDDDDDDRSEEVDVTKRYPIEGKFLDEADRARIMRMTEIEREAILAERDREIETHLQNQQLRQLLQKRNREKTSGGAGTGASTGLKKRKRRGASADDSDDRGRRDDDDDDDDEDLKPEEYRRLRQNRGDGRRQSPGRRGRTFDRSRSRSRSSHSSDRRSRSSSSSRRYRRRDSNDYDPYSTSRSGRRGRDRDRSDSRHSRSRFRSRSRDQSSSPPEETVDLHHFEKVRVGRSDFGNICLFPTFDKLIVGSYCRVVTGFDPVTKQNVYRMGRVDAVAEPGEPYELIEKRTKVFMTDQRLTLSRGKSTREWALALCSDSPFTRAEFEDWKTVCALDGIAMPTIAQLEEKAAELAKLFNYKWTNQGLTEKLERQTRFPVPNRDRADPNINLSQDVGTGSFGDGGSGLDTVADAGPETRNDRLSARNKAVRDANRDEAIQAQIRQRRAVLAAREAAARKAGVVSGSNKPGNGLSGGSSTTTTTTVSISTPSLTGTATTTTTTATMTESGTPAKVKTPTTLLTRSTPKSGVPSVVRVKTDDELIGELDLDIDVMI